MWALGGDFHPLYLVQPGKRRVRRVSVLPAPPGKTSLAPIPFSPSSRVSKPCRHATVRKKRQRQFSNSDPVLETSTDDVIINAAKHGSVIAFRVELNLYGRTVRALVDSGATRTFLGSSLIEFLDDLGLKTRRIPPRSVLTANGQVETIYTTSGSRMIRRSIVLFRLRQRLRTLVANRLQLPHYDVKLKGISRLSHVLQKNG